MKTLIQAVAVAVALAAPVASFAQSNAPVTRAQVRAEVVQLAQAGYHVGDGDNTRYPEAVQAAEAATGTRAPMPATLNAATARARDLRIPDLLQMGGGRRGLATATCFWRTRSF